MNIYTNYSPYREMRIRGETGIRKHIFMRSCVFTFNLVQNPWAYERVGQCPSIIFCTSKHCLVWCVGMYRQIRASIHLIICILACCHSLGHILVNKNLFHCRPEHSFTGLFLLCDFLLLAVTSDEYYIWLSSMRVYLVTSASLHFFVEGD